MRDGSFSNAVRFLDHTFTLTNDVGKWGPWAGKVITGDESTTNIYAIDPNGVVTSFNLGINPEDFDIIPPDQDLYCVNFHENEPSSVLKLPRQCLANYVGDLLITQAGESGLGDVTVMFIVSWNGAGFAVRRIPVSSDFGGWFEHVTFAPLDLPAVNP